MPQTINQKTKRVLEKIAKSFLAKKFYLAGGTALAIQLGHRQSIDLDWFSAENFSNKEIKNNFSKLGAFELTSEDEGTIYGTLDGIKVSFLFYGYKMIYPLIDYRKVKLADERDIAAMKIDAVSSRGSKKDFIDLYFLLERYSLPELLSFFEKKYEKIRFNKLHILKSLVYFEDADEEPMPKMIKKAGWEQIKNKIAKESNKIIK